MPIFFDVAASLHELPKNSKVPRWGEPQEKALQTLKDLLCGTPVLAYPVAGEKFILVNDASGYGVLSQAVNSAKKLIACYSRALSKPERNYCVTRRELLAVLD